MTVEQDGTDGRVAHDQERVVSARTSLRGQFGALWTYRELLVGLVRKELRVKYRGTALGFAWSMVTPAMTLGIYYVVFNVILTAGIPNFAIFLMSGLVVWNLFSSGVAAAAGSVVGNAPIVNKVYFPRLVLPVSAVGAGIVHFALQGLVLLGAIVLTQNSIEYSWLPLVVAAFLVLVVLTLALGVLMSALNVHARDTQHFLELILMGWFWLTPIIYQYQLVANRLISKGWPEHLALLNPITSITLAFQRVFYNTIDGASATDRPSLSGEAATSQILPDESFLWYFRNVAVVGVLSVVLLIVAIEVFSRLEGNFAEEL